MLLISGLCAAYAALMPTNPSIEYHASVCRSGHVITSMLELKSGDRPFCAKCGSPAVTRCPSCDGFIPGDNSGIIGYRWSPPNHCHLCGNAFPWTEARKEAARELAAYLAESPEEEAALADGVDALLTDGPRTPVAAARWRRAIDRHGRNGLDLAKDLFIGVVSNTVAAHLGLTR